MDDETFWSMNRRPEFLKQVFLAETPLEELELMFVSLAECIKKELAKMNLYFFEDSISPKVESPKT